VAQRPSPSGRAQLQAATQILTLQDLDSAACTLVHVLVAQWNPMMVESEGDSAFPSPSPNLVMDEHDPLWPD